MDVKAGFVDTGSNAPRAATTTTPKFTAYAPPPIKKHTLAKQKAEQVKAAKAAAELAAARERVAEKQAAKTAAAAAQKSGTKNVTKPEKPKKIRREKIRYGQAPRNSLPAGLPSEASNNGPIEGVAPGVAMAPTESTTSNITTGATADADPLAGQQEAPTQKTRFATRQTEQTAKVDEAKLNKAMMKATDHPVAPTKQEAADEKTQAAPLGLNGDTTRKPAKPKRKKGDPKNRLQEKPKPTEPAPIAPTVNPALDAGTGATPAPSTTTPPATTPTPK
jgi:peptidyl-prolyl cis-trans isomerase SurA